MLLRYSRPIALREFGILIPIAPDRAEQVVSSLSSRLPVGTLDSLTLGPDGTSVTRDDLLRVHAPRYVDRVLGDEAESVMLEVFELIDEEGEYFRYDPSTAARPLAELAGDWRRWMAGSAQCAQVALERGFCFYLGGGAHHGHREFGHGFCIFNDIMVAARMAQAGGVGTVWIIDVDAHKGDGTAALAAGDDSIITVSVHMADGWPLSLDRFAPDGSEHPSFTPSTIDVPIAEGEEVSYLPRLGQALGELDRMQRADLAIVVDGADPYEHDGLESSRPLRLALDQLVERDRLIYSFLAERGIPQAWLMSGGYGERAWEPPAEFLSWALQQRYGS